MAKPVVPQEKDLALEFKLIKEETAKAQAELQAKAEKRLAQVLEPALDRLARLLDDAHRLIMELDEHMETNSIGQPTYLNEERFKQPVDFFKKRLGVTSTRGGAGGTRKGGRRIGRPINDAIKEFGGKDGLTIADICTRKELKEEEVRAYIEAHKDKYKQTGDKFTLAK